MISEIITNPFFYVPAGTWISGQFIKFFVQWFKGSFDPKYLIASGGMPSVHSAVVISLATAAALKLGFGDPLFGVLLVLAGIVIYDSFGVRRLAGEEAQVLNQLIADLSRRREIDNTYGHVREALGHKPNEVLVGSFLGVIFGSLLVNINHFRWLYGPEFIFAEPSSLVFDKIFLVAFAAMIGVGLLVKLWAIWRHFRGPSKRLYHRIFMVLIIGGGLGLLYLFAVAQSARIISWPIFFYLIILLWFVGLLWIASYRYRRYGQEMIDYLERKRKEQWIPQPKSR